MITPDQIKAARKLLGWSAVTLAAKVGVSATWLRRYEVHGLSTGSKGRVSAMVAALEAAGVEFTNEEQPGVRMKKA